MEIIYVDPMTMPEVDSIKIPAGVMAVIPSVEWDDAEDRVMPENTILCAGQTLPRDHYPELSQIYHYTGGFNHFQLPDLMGKFIIGINEDGEVIRGDGIIYFKSIPEIQKRSRDIRDL